ncbi:hypothetical protein [Lactococcus formosensis]|uniref:hypothetical protein n=1 Tax=Lactococcus formosensis TaxID=1281486 RepID=UPI00254B4363|nr:hypothetical protein [Lactococcus formosensis]
MKKLLVITDITLVLVAVLLIFAVQQDENSVVAPTVGLVKADQYSPEKTINVEQIKRGNFETIQGEWVNDESDIDGRTVRILDAKVIKQKREFHLRYGGIDEQTGQVYLWMYLEGIAPENSSRFEIYPKGSPIPVKLRNGTIDYSGKYDPTFRGEDRILPEGSARTVEELASLVLYRDTETKA